MKKILIAISFFLVKTSFSQAGYDYFLAPAEEMTIPVGGKLTLHVQTMNADGNILQADPAFVGQWTINGKETADPQYGNISHGLSFVNATYTAPDKVPAKNPVAIAVSFKTRSQGNESKITLVCTITITDAKNYFFLGKTSALNKAGFGCLVVGRSKRPSQSRPIAGHPMQSEVRKFFPER